MITCPTNVSQLSLGAACPQAVLLVYTLSGCVQVFLMRKAMSLSM